MSDLNMNTLGMQGKWDAQKFIQQRRNIFHLSVLYTQQQKDLINGIASKFYFAFLEDSTVNKQ